MKKIVIGITGQKQSGKNTLGNEIIKRHSGFVQYAFADPVREAAKAFFGWTDEEMSKNKETIDPFWGISPRQALQFIGTEVGRQGFGLRFSEFNKTTGDTIWIKRFYKFLENTKPYQHIVITDVRFLNEVNAILNLDGNKYLPIIVGVMRNGYDGDNHASETEVPKCIEKSTYVLENNYGIDTVAKFATSLLDELEWKINRIERVENEYKI